jgi:hypothetical protein
MVALPSMSQRGRTLLQSVRTTFALLDEHAKIGPLEVDEIVAMIVSHIRSWMPQILASDRPVDPLTPPTDKDAEIAKLRLEVDTMRPVFVAAFEWQEHDHDADHTIALARAVMKAGCHG